MNPSLSPATPTDSAVAEAFRSHAGLVERVLRRAGVPERDLPDLRQEVFIVVHRRLGEFEGRASLSTWLYRIAWHVASDHRRRAYQRRERLAESDRPAGADSVDGADSADGPAALHASGAEPCDALAGLEQRRLVEHALRALATLDPDQREAFVLAELYELPMREVAARQGCPQKTAFSRTYAARRRILAELQRVGALQLFPLFIPWRALRGLQLNGAVAGALVPAAALLPVAGGIVFALAALIALHAFEPPAPRATGVAEAAPSAARVATPRAEPAASRSDGTAVARSQAALPAAAPALASPARDRARGPAARRADPSPTAVPPAPAAAPSAAPQPEEEMIVVRSGALELRPAIEHPFAAAPPVAAPARITLRGPGDAADGIERALAADPLFAYPIARE